MNILSTSKLVSLLEEWVSIIQSRGPEEADLYDHVAQCLSLSRAFLAAVGPVINVDLVILLSSVSQTLHYAVDRAFDASSLPQGSKVAYTWANLVPESFWKARFSASGYCPSQVSIILANSNSLQTLHYLASYDQSATKNRHVNCSTEHCEAYQNKLDSYQTKHAVERCRCDDIVVVRQQLFDILKAGSLPLLRIDSHGPTSQELSLSVIASNNELSYVALSHVWADGLGNPNANSLPKCQIFRLKSLVEQLRREVGQDQELLLWVDTLSCPTAPGEAHTLAMAQMHRTYAQASYVLVLDASLGNLDLPALSTYEACTRIMLSSWMRRLWTLQEGALPTENPKARKLYFQFGGHPVCARDLLARVSRAWFSSIKHKGLAGDILKRLGTFTSLLLQNSDYPGADLATITSALQYRSVSVSSDEPLLIGSLLGLDVAKILHTSAKSTRFHRLWHLMPSAVGGIPKDMIFRVGPRLADKGMRWAPSTLLFNTDNNFFFGRSFEPHLQGFPLEGAGLNVRLPGFRLSQPQDLGPQFKNIKVSGFPENSNRTWMTDKKGSWYLLNRRLSVEVDSYLTNETLAEILHDTAGLWITFANPDFPAPAGSKNLAFLGLIVRVRGQEAEILSAQSILHVSFGAVTRPMQTWLQKAYEAAQELRGSQVFASILDTARNGHDTDVTNTSHSISALDDQVHLSASRDHVKAALSLVQSMPDDQALYFAKEYIWDMLQGRYVCFSDQVPQTQEWCID
ncbi:MAG: hypothetical protein Q9220_001619 [cf. Caloplaca sp. 1 TL-2023]